MEIRWDIWDLEKGGKSNPKLIPVKKMVYKKGFSHMQTFWVLPDELHGNHEGIHNHLKEHLRHVRKTLGSDKYKEALKNSGVKWEEHPHDQINTMKATSAAIEHLKNGGTITHDGDNGEHTITGKHQSEFAKDQNAEDNSEKPYHVFIKGEGFKPVKGSPVHIGDGLDTFLHQDPDGKWLVSEAHSGMKITGTGYDTKEEAIGQAKKLVEQLGMDKVKETIKGVIQKNGISPSHSHKQEDYIDGTEKDAKPTVPVKKKEPEVEIPKHLVPAKEKEEVKEDKEEIKQADPSTATAKDMNGESVKVGDTVKDTNGKNFVITKIEANGTVWGKRIGKGKENANEKVIKNQFKKFAPTKSEHVPSVPAGKKAVEEVKNGEVKNGEVDLHGDTSIKNAWLDLYESLIDNGYKGEERTKIKQLVQQKQYVKALTDVIDKHDHGGNDTGYADIVSKLNALAKTINHIGEIKAKKAQEQPTVAVAVPATKTKKQLKFDIPTTYEKPKPDSAPEYTEDGLIKTKYIPVAPPADAKSKEDDVADYFGNKLKGVAGISSSMADEIKENGWNPAIKEITSKWLSDGKITEDQLKEIKQAYSQAKSFEASYQTNQLGQYVNEASKYGPTEYSPMELSTIKSYFSSWFSSSGSPQGTAMRYAVLKAGMVHQKTFDILQTYLKNKQHSEQGITNAIDHNYNEVIHNGLIKLYNQVQKDFQEKPQFKGKTVVLYRGIGGSMYKDELGSTGKVTYNHNPLDSWTTRAEKAADFGKFIMRMEVPIEHILTSIWRPETPGHGGGHEEEWFPLPQDFGLNLELGKNVWMEGFNSIPKDILEADFKHNHESGWIKEKYLQNYGSYKNGVLGKSVFFENERDIILVKGGKRAMDGKDDDTKKKPVEVWDNDGKLEVWEGLTDEDRESAKRIHQYFDDKHAFNQAKMASDAAKKTTKNKSEEQVTVKKDKKD